MAASSSLRENVYPIIFFVKMLVYIILFFVLLLAWMLKPMVNDVLFLYVFRYRCYYLCVIGIGVIANIFGVIYLFQVWMLLPVFIGIDGKANIVIGVMLYNIIFLFAQMV